MLAWLIGRLSEVIYHCPWAGRVLAWSVFIIHSPWAGRVRIQNDSCHGYRLRVVAESVSTVWTSARAAHVHAEYIDFAHRAIVPTDKVSLSKFLLQLIVEASHHHMAVATWWEGWDGKLAGVHGKKAVRIKI